MNKLLVLLFSLLLSTSVLAGCVTEPEDDTTPEDNTGGTGPTDDGATVNGTDPNSGSGNSNGGSTDTATPTNSTDDNTGGSSGGGSSGGTTTPTNDTDDPSDPSGGGSSGGGSSGGGSSGGGSSGGGSSSGGSTGTTDCGSGDGTYSSTMIAFDLSAHPDFTNIGGIEIDCPTNMLYGYAWDSVTEIEHFISIDPSNGAVTSLTELSGIEMVSNSATYSDGEYFAIMRGGTTVYLVQVSVSNPSAYSMTEFDYTNHPELGSVAGIEYNHSGDIIYAYAADTTTGSSGGASPGQSSNANSPDRYLVTVEPSTGLVAKYTELIDVEGIADGASAFDGENYYLNAKMDGGGYTMLNISTDDFSYTTSTVLTSSNTDLMSPNGFEINTSTGLIYGYAWDSVAEEEVYISYDIATEAIQVVGTIDGVQYVTSDSTIGGGDFYAIMAGPDRVPKLVHIQY